MQDIYSLFFHAGEIVEIRAIGLFGKNHGWEGFARETVAGYFDNAKDFGKCAIILNDAGATGVYFTLNPCKPALIARASNRLRVMKYTTQDKDIKCVRWLPIDLDPKRPSGISATDAEVALAQKKALIIASWLASEVGWESPIRGFSGNGYHLLYKLPDLPNNDETHKTIMQCISIISGKFSDDHVDIDVSVGNPARIWKLFGSTGRKGDNTLDRPHRKSFIIENGF